MFLAIEKDILQSQDCIALLKKLRSVISSSKKNDGSVVDTLFARGTHNQIMLLLESTDILDQVCQYHSHRFQQITNALVNFRKYMRR